MAVPEHVHRFWRAMDALFSDVRPTWWGAVVTDGRFPRIWDANYARIDEPVASLGAADVEEELLPALAAAGVDVLHVVTFHPDVTTGLLSELSSRGHRLTWDLVMDADARPVQAPVADVAVEELALDEALWDRVADSLALFGVEPGEAVAQLRLIEADVLARGGKRWFGVRDPDGAVVSLGALLLLEGVGYVDNVVTFPQARGRGYASAVTARIVEVAQGDGAEHVCLFADPGDAPVVRMYRRLGFRDAGTLAATRGPVP
ncbi:MAG: GNAT family N-acetyltransferase [Actinomycetota bacterium]